MWLPTGYQLHLSSWYGSISPDTPDFACRAVCFVVFSARVRAQVDERVLQESEKYIGCIEGQKQRMHQGGRLIDIREIIGQGKDAEKKQAVRW